jgi:hypothetical protein
MPTATQLTHLAPVDGDGASTVTNDDGSKTTTWPDGTTRNDETDGTATVTFPDGSMLTVAANGTETLKDANGNALDPNTGQPLSNTAQDQTIPTPPPTTVDQLNEIVEGVSTLADLAGAEGILKAFGVAAVVDKRYGALAELTTAFADALKGDLSPAGWFTQVLKMVLAVVKALETEERGVGMRSWCYTVVYDAMSMGVPPEPTFSGSLQGPDQDATDKQWWEDSRKQAQDQLSDGQNGVALRNRVLLLIAKCGGDPATAVTEMWAEACRESDDDQLLAAYPQLSWPQPTGA